MTVVPFIKEEEEMKLQSNYQCELGTMNLMIIMFVNEETF